MYHDQTSYASKYFYCCIQTERLLRDTERNLSAVAKLFVCFCVMSETSFENAGQETSVDVCQTVGSLELHNDLTHYYNVPGVSDVVVTLR